jgi:hypothetical protein
LSNDNTFEARKPAFSLGDRVLVTGPGIHHDRHGLVMEIIEPNAVLVYRYRVRFTDGTAATVFGFELEKLPDRPTAES